MHTMQERKERTEMTDHKAIVEDRETKIKVFRPVEDIIKAREALSKLCKGDRMFMSIPVQVDDWDIVLSRVIKRAENCIDKDQLIERLEAMEEPLIMEGYPSDCNFDHHADGWNDCLDTIIKELRDANK